MDLQHVANLLAELERTIGHVDPRTDARLHALLKDATAAFSAKDGQGVLRAARQLEEHALYRYAAVVEAAGALRRSLEGP